MKTIYAKDIRAIVKKFNLTEIEEYYLKDIAEQINKEKSDTCFDIQDVLVYNSIKDIETVVSSLILYFGNKIQKDSNTLKFDFTTFEIAKTLKCGTYQVEQWIKKTKQINRFKKFVDYSLTFGQNYLEIA